MLGCAVPPSRATRRSASANKKSAGCGAWPHNLAKDSEKASPCSPPHRTCPWLRGRGSSSSDQDLAVISINSQAQQWLSDLDNADWPTNLELPLPIYAAVAQVIGNEHEPTTAPTATRPRRAEGGWITVQASPLKGPAGDQIAVILDTANAAQLSSLVLAAHGLTAAQSRVAALVLQGRSTRHIVNELHISSNTVQEHLKAVFDKFGIGSRRELVAALSGRPH